MATSEDAASAAVSAATAEVAVEIAHTDYPKDTPRSRHSMDLIRQQCAERLQRQLQNSSLRVEKASQVAASPRCNGGFVEPSARPSVSVASKPRSSPRPSDGPHLATASRAAMHTPRSPVPRATAGTSSATGRTSTSKGSRAIPNNVAARTPQARYRTVSASTPRPSYRSLGLKEAAANAAATALGSSPGRRQSSVANRTGAMRPAASPMLWAGSAELADRLSTEIFDAAKVAAEAQTNDVSSTASSDDGVKHFSIADCSSSSPQPASRAQHFQEVAQTLETALSAVSAVKHGKKPELDCSAIAHSASMPPQRSATPLGSLHHSMKDTTTARSGFRQPLHVKRSSFDRATSNSFATSRSEAVKNAMANLSLENRALRGALTDAVRRLSELEGEQNCLMSDSVFDLVNSVCQEGSACNMAAAEARAAEEAASGSCVTSVQMPVFSR